MIIMSLLGMKRHRQPLHGLLQIHYRLLYVSTASYLGSTSRLVCLLLIRKCDGYQDCLIESRIRLEFYVLKKVSWLVGSFLGNRVK